MEVTEGMIPTISRRAFVASLMSGGVLWALTGEAQQAGKVYRVGVIFHEPLRSRYSDPLRDGLRQFGYVEGHNLKLEIRSANERPERYASLTADLMNRNVDVFVTVGTPATLGIGQSTRSIPIVMVLVGDPVAFGIVQSLARPGGNVTDRTRRFQGTRGCVF